MLENDVTAMAQKSSRKPVNISTASSADIAFLLLVFFLVTTTLVQPKGIRVILPPAKQLREQIPVEDRNVFTINVNSEDELMAEGKIYNDTLWLIELRKFILNFGQPSAEDLHLLSSLAREHQLFQQRYGGKSNASDAPRKAVVSIKVHRGTSYRTYLHTLDAVQKEYHTIYASRVGVPLSAYLNLNPNSPKERKLLRKARQGIPMQISLAEPD